MDERISFPCVNCGTEIAAPPVDVDVIQCPVCEFLNDLREPEATAPVTADDLGASLDMLIASARAGGLDQEEIVRVLRDELEFAAELAHAGRNMTVQIIDLGPADSQSPRPPVRDRSSVLRGRAVSH